MGRVHTSPGKLSFITFEDKTWSFGCTVVWCAAIQLTSSCPIYAHSKHDGAVFGVRSHFSSCTCLSLQIYLMTWLPFMQNANTLHGHFFLSSWFISWFVTAFLSEAEQRTGSQTEQSSFLWLIQSFIVIMTTWQRRTQYMRVWDTVEASRVRETCYKDTCVCVKGLRSPHEMILLIDIKATVQPLVVKDGR